MALSAAALKLIQAGGSALFNDSTVKKAATAIRSLPEAADEVATITRKATTSIQTQTVDDLVDSVAKGIDDSVSMNAANELERTTFNAGLDDINVSIAETSLPKFEYKPGEKVAARFSTLREADVTVKKASEGALAPKEYELYPVEFTEADTSSVSRAYNWATREFNKFFTDFKSPDWQVKRSAAQRSPYRAETVVKNADGTYALKPVAFTSSTGKAIKLYNPIKLREWLRAAEALSHDFSMSEAINYIDQVPIPEYLARGNTWDPWDPHKWAAIKNDYIDPIQKEVERVSINMREVRDEGASLGQLIQDAPKVSWLNEEDLLLLQSYNKVNQYGPGGSPAIGPKLLGDSGRTVTRKIIEEGLRRFHGNDNFAYYDGSVDAFLYGLDRATMTYVKYAGTSLESSAKMLLKAYDDIAKGSRYTIAGQEMPSTLRLIEHESKLQAAETAAKDYYDFVDEAAEFRVHETTSLFDESINPPMAGSKYGGGIKDDPRTASIRKERDARTDLAAGYTGQTELTDPDFIASRSKGITDFAYTDHALPGEMLEADMQATTSFIESAEDSLRAIDQELGEAAVELDIGTWDEIVTQKYFAHGYNLDETASIDYTQSSAAIDPMYQAEQAMAKYGAEKIAIDMYAIFGKNMSGPRFVGSTSYSATSRSNINILKMNTADDIRGFYNDLAIARSGDTDVSGLPDSFFANYGSNKDFTAETGITVGKNIPIEVRDTLYAGVSMIRRAVIGMAEAVSSSAVDPLTQVSEKAILGKFLNIGGALQMALEGVPSRVVEQSMDSWNLAARDGQSLAKRIYAVTHENYSQVFDDSFDAMDYELAARMMAVSDSDMSTNHIMGSLAGTTLSTTKAAKKLDSAKRGFIARLDQLKNEADKVELDAKLAPVEEAAPTTTAVEGAAPVETRTRTKEPTPNNVTEMATQLYDALKPILGDTNV